MSFNPPPLPPVQPPWGQFQVWWQEVLGQLKGELGALETAEAALAAAVSAQATADAANTSASIGLGWTSPGELLSSVDNGTNANIVIASHVRHYGDSTEAPVTGATITGDYGTDYFIYYDDPTRAGGAVSFQKATDPNVAANNAATGRHYCGSVLTATSGGTATTGGGTVPPGGDYSGPGAIP